MIGSGKTSVGRILAERLGVPLEDIGGALRPRAGVPPGAMFDRAGEEALPPIEASILRRRPALGGNRVIALPASAVVQEDVRVALRRAPNVVWLRARSGTLEERLRGEELAGRRRYAANVRAWLSARNDELASLYAAAADATVDVDELAPWQVAQVVLDALGLSAFGWLPGSYQGVVLDMDGLLVDTEVLWQQAARRLYAARGAPYTIDDHRAVVGTSEEFTAREFARRLGLDERRADQIRSEYLGHATDIFAGGVPVRAGAVELVTSLRGRVPVGLASNTRRDMVTDTLERSGLAGCFDVIVSGDEADPKPAPGIYLEACRQLGVDPHRSVAVEDSPTGMRAAKAAGLTGIGVPSDPGHPLAEADCVRASLLELIEPSA